jgi:hypothetical protein
LLGIKLASELLMLGMFQQLCIIIITLSLLVNPFDENKAAEDSFAPVDIVGN